MVGQDSFFQSSSPRTSVQVLSKFYVQDLRKTEENFGELLSYVL